MYPVICILREPYALTEKDLPELLSIITCWISQKAIASRSESRAVNRHRIPRCHAMEELFPCHPFVGDEAYSMGNFWDGITRPELQCQFQESKCYTKPECQDCWGKLYCNGGCPANALHEDRLHKLNLRV